LERCNLPPATYGAGKNLFTNPVLSFFMHNLGAYRVDRRLKHALYKDVLKAYSTVLIERGYHSLFFPGGTRSRSGGIERKLKLGLAGTGLEAFIRSTERGRPQRVFFVPATINYLLTLEAETLIDDFLQEEGKARYIIDDDESTRVGSIAAFMQKLVRAESSVVIRFSDPLDCFGNKVDARGQSFDRRHRAVDAKSYIFDTADKPVREGQRDAQYTRELGEAICEAYKRDTVVMATHVVAAAAFDRLKRDYSGRATSLGASSGRPSGHGKPDIFALLRHHDDVRVPRAELAADVDALLGRIRKQHENGQIVMSPAIANASGDDAIGQAIRAFSGYHSHEIIAASGRDLLLTDTRLLFYYQNRLAAHGLATDFIAPKAKTAA
ncbi:MAG: 1-acyl-sn-glycerol-3-phosphate acyltransferase, partial [Polyangiaceae bacterium]